MRSLMWIITLLLAFGALAVGLDGRFAGARTISYALGLFAFFACPFLWARPDGLVPDELSMSAKTRLTLTVALVMATPLLLPWKLWL